MRYHSTCNLPDGVSNGVVDSYVLVPGVTAKNIVKYYKINVRYHSTCVLPDSDSKGGNVVDGYVLV